MTPTLRVSTTQIEGVYQAAKWLQARVLLDIQELQELFKALQPFYIFLTSGVYSAKEEHVDQSRFLEHYSTYIQELKMGHVPDTVRYRSFFSAVMTTSPECLYAMPVGTDKHVVKVAKPVVQLQPLHIDYSPLDGKFHGMLRSTEAISWGVQFSYPQIFQDPVSKNIEKVDSSEKFSNTAFFLKLQRWLRHNSRPTPFLVEGKVINVPIRLGHDCFAWINDHPQLKSRGIQVALSTASREEE